MPFRTGAQPGEEPASLLLGKSRTFAVCNILHPAPLTQKKSFFDAQPFAHQPHQKAILMRKNEVSPLSLSIYSTIN